MYVKLNVNAYTIADILAKDKKVVYAPKDKKAAKSILTNLLNKRVEHEPAIN